MLTLERWEILSGRKRLEIDGELRGMDAGNATAEGECGWRGRAT